MQQIDFLSLSKTQILKVYRGAPGEWRVVLNFS